MDDHDEKDNELNERDDSKAESPNEDIPLWLQGIEEPESDETKPIIPKDADASSWVREIEDNISEPANEDESDSLGSVDPNRTEFETEIDLRALDDAQPLNRFEDEHSQNDSLADEIPDISEDHEITEEIDIQEFPEKFMLDEIEPDFNEDSSIEGFVDISEVGFAEQPGEMEDILDDEPLTERELPEWLQEMIAESEQEADQLEPDLVDEPESKLPEHDSTPDTILPAMEQSVEELLQEDEMLLSSDTQEPDFDLEYAFSIAKEDTTPVELATDNLEPALTDEGFPDEEDFPILAEEMVDEEFQPSYDEEVVFHDLPDIEEESAVQEEKLYKEEGLIAEEIAELIEEAPGSEALPPSEEIEQEVVEESPEFKDTDPFDRAKQYLEQGQISDALPIINDLVEDSDHLAQLDVWLKEFAESDTTKTSEVMETLGDIALKQNKPDVALDAYAKALKLLLENNEVSDEIG